MPLNLEALSKGHEFPSVAFHLSSQWVREYAEAVEDGAIAGLGRDMVPPMAVAALSIRALLDSARLPTGAIHLGQEVAFFRPVGMGERLSAAGRDRQPGRTSGLGHHEDRSQGRGRGSRSRHDGSDYSDHAPGSGPGEPDLKAMTEQFDREAGPKVGGELSSVAKVLTQEKIDRYAPRRWGR